MRAVASAGAASGCRVAHEHIPSRVSLSSAAALRVEKWTAVPSPSSRPAAGRIPPPPRAKGWYYDHEDPSWARTRRRRSGWQTRSRRASPPVRDPPRIVVVRPTLRRRGGSGRWCAVGRLHPRRRSSTNRFVTASQRYSTSHTRARRRDGGRRPTAITILLATDLEGRQGTATTHEHEDPKPGDPFAADGFGYEKVLWHGLHRLRRARLRCRRRAQRVCAAWRRGASPSSTHPDGARRPERRRLKRQNDEATAIQSDAEMKARRRVRSISTSSTVERR